MTSKVVYLENLRTEITHLSSGQKSITDAPVDNHGKGEAFSPTDLLATSLAACMLTVMGIKAEQHELHIDGSYAEVQKHMESNPRRVSQIEVRLYIKGRFSQSEKSLLQQTALNCPVAKSLHPDLTQSVSFRYED